MAPSYLEELEKTLRTILEKTLEEEGKAFEGKLLFFEKYEYNHLRAYLMQEYFGWKELEEKKTQNEINMILGAEEVFISIAEKIKLGEFEKYKTRVTECRNKDMQCTRDLLKDMLKDKYKLLKEILTIELKG